MKTYIKTISVVVLFFSCTMSFGQDKNIAYQDKVASLDAIIHSLYTVISGEKGEARDWELFKFLFHEDAKLIPSGKNKVGIYKARYLSPQDYIDSSGKWLEENGFFENELSRSVHTFGNISQVFSTYESFRSMSDSIPFMRGINSIQLLNDGTRWWIINIYWAQETAQNPIPEKYLLPKN